MAERTETPPRKRARVDGQKEGGESACPPRSASASPPVSPSASGSRSSATAPDSLTSEDRLARAREAARMSMAEKAARRKETSGNGPSVAAIADGEGDGSGSDGDDANNAATTSAGPAKAASISPPPTPPPRPLPHYTSHPTITQCASIHTYTRLNHIEEGSYGVVFRARHNPSGDIVAIKRLKMDRERNGFPITSLREIRTLMMAQHENVVRVREVVVGDTLTQIYIAFEFVEHDLKTLLTELDTPFVLSEIKTLMQQLLRAVELLHSQWIIHRDIKTSNLLINNRGCLKLADFGLARLYGDSNTPQKMTELVVTLWYRAPELLLGAKEYDTAIDMWSVGCILAELLLQEPLFPGRNESDQIQRIFKLLGQPDPSAWPALHSLPLYRRTSSSKTYQPYSLLRSQFPASLSSTALDLLHKLLTYDPSKRATATEALAHPWFTESPLPAHPESFGSFPSIAAGERRRRSEQQPLSPKKQQQRQHRRDGAASRTASPSQKTYSLEWDF